MDVFVHDSLNCNLQLYHFGLLQQHQQQSLQSYFPFQYFYQDYRSMTDIQEMDQSGDDASAQDKLVKISGSYIKLDPEIEGYLAPHRVKPVISCEACCLEFSSQSVLDAHIKGNKHQKKIQNLELMKSLEPLQDEFERNEVSGVIRCTICNICVNSFQLLATHMAGNKHKSKASKRKRGDDDMEEEPPAKRPHEEGEEGMDVETSQTPKKKKKKKKKKKSAAAVPGEEASTDVTPDEAAITNPSLPECVIVKDAESGGQYYECSLCNATCNSMQQILQHLSSKKHMDKDARQKNPDEGSTWRGRGGGGGGGRGRWQRFGLGGGRGSRGRYDGGRGGKNYRDTYSSSFVSEGDDTSTNSYENGQGYKNRGHGYNNRGQGYNNRGQGYNNRGHGYNNRGQGYNNRGQGYNNWGGNQGYNNQGTDALGYNNQSGQGYNNQAYNMQSSGQGYGNQDATGQGYNDQAYNNGSYVEGANGFDSGNSNQTNGTWQQGSKTAVQTPVDGSSTVGEYNQAGYNYNSAYPGQYYGYDISNYAGGKEAAGTVQNDPNLQWSNFKQ